MLRRYFNLHPWEAAELPEWYICALFRGFEEMLPDDDEGGA